MLTDSTIIHRHGRHQVLAQKWEVQFRDGQLLGLHLVTENGQPARFLRAVVSKTAGVFVFDLRHIDRTLDLDIRYAHDRDVPGLVFYGMRRVCPTVQDFLWRVGHVHISHWRPDGTPPLPRRMSVVDQLLGEGRTGGALVQQAAQRAALADAARATA